MDRPDNREKRAVLVIDNDRTASEKLKKYLVDGGYRVFATADLHEAIKVAKEQRVVVVLLALGQAGLEPERLIKSLQSEKRDGKLAVIVILDSFDEDMVSSALMAGATDYLTRPVDSQELLRRIGVYARIDACSAGDDGDKISALQVPEPLSLRTGFTARLLLWFAELIQFRFGADEFLGYRYEKAARLGIGSFGEVWKVKDAVNVPPAIFVAKIPLSKKLNPKIEKEARILRMLADHAGVPEVHEVIEVQQKRALIQEFVEGKTLYEVIQRELEEKEVESVIIQLIDIVAHAHDLGIIHRDIKPGNIMVRPDGTIKLLDFGAAKELKEKEMSGTVTGSRPYMSPEQIMGKSQRRSDVWALGVVMFVLYTGMFPFYNEVEKVLMDMILELPPPRPSKLSASINPEMERIILQCLEKNPESRHPDAGALKNAIITIFPGYGKRILPLY